MKKLAVFIAGLLVLFWGQVAGQEVSIEWGEIAVGVAGKKTLSIDLDKQNNRLWVADNSADSLGFFNLNFGLNCYLKASKRGIPRCVLYDSNTQFAITTYGGSLAKVNLQEWSYIKIGSGVLDWCWDNLTQKWYGVGVTWNESQQKILGALFSYKNGELETLLDNLPVNSGRHLDYGNNIGPECLRIDSQGRIWFGGFDGLRCYNPTTKVLTEPKDLNQVWLPGRPFHGRGIFYDQPTDRIFIGVYGSDGAYLAIVDPTNNQLLVTFNSLPRELCDFEYPSNNTLDPGRFIRIGRILIMGAYWDNDLVLYNLDTKRFALRTEFPNVCIFRSFKVDSRTNRIYFATYSTVGWFKIKGNTVVVEDDDEEEQEEEEQKVPEIPQEFALYQNYPNPFNPTTTIQYDIPTSQKVYLSIYNLLGQEVVVLVDEEKGPGRHSVVWQADVPAGVYLCKIQINKFSRLIKMSLVK